MENTRCKQRPCFGIAIKALFPVLGFAVWLGTSELRAQTYEDGYGAVEITESNSARGRSPTLERSYRTSSQRQLRPGDRVGRRYSQAPDESAQDETDTGRDAAQKYMRPRRPSDGEGTEGRRPSQASSDAHYLAVHGGVFVSDTAYKWSRPDQQDNIGTWNFGVTYRVGEWVNSMDLNLRVDLARIAPSAGPTTKLSFLPVVTFPDAGSRFPLYFGIGAGLGIFTNQIDGESSLTLDYQLLAGARFFNLWGQTGLFVEGGLKNSLFLLSDGQFNATFVAGGLVFTF